MQFSKIRLIKLPNIPGIVKVAAMKMESKAIAGFKKLTNNRREAFCTIKGQISVLFAKKFPVKFELFFKLRIFSKQILIIRTA